GPPHIFRFSQHRLERGKVLRQERWIPEWWPRGDDSRACRSTADRQARSIRPGPAPTRAREREPQEGRPDRAGQTLAANHEPDRDGHRGKPDQEIRRAVERVDRPVGGGATTAS